MADLRHGSLFTGYAGLDMATESVLAGSVAWHCEHEPATDKNPHPTQAAAKVLGHRYPAVPNLGDITEVDWATVEPVDVLTAGYPCQPFSSAGQRRGEGDDRYMWPEVERAIRGLGPQLVVLENVSGHLVRGFPGVLGSLAALGYDARWLCLRASAVGAPHRRERVFCVAWPAADADGRRREDGPELHGEPAFGATDRDSRRVHIDGRPAADPQGAGPQRTRPQPERRGSEPGDITAAHADDRSRDGWQREQVGVTVGRASSARTGESGHGRPTADWGPYRVAVERWARIIGRPAPAPTEHGRHGGQRLSPRFVEWMMGLPAGWVTDAPISRNDQLKVLGNGVVPQQAIAALRWLLTPQDSSEATA